MVKVNYPMDGLCGAKNRSGNPCRKHPVKGRNRCANHGGLTLTGKDHGRYKFGHYTKEAIEESRRVSELLKEARQFLLEAGSHIA